MVNLNIVIIGGTGFIGRTLSRAILDAGYAVTVLSRHASAKTTLSGGIASIQADVTKPGEWQAIIGNYDVVVNLAGVSIFRRWTAKAKRRIIESRVAATKNIVDALRYKRGNLSRFFSISGVGYYGFHGDEILDEDNPAGSDFLASVAARWEKEAERAQELGINLSILRLGHVLGVRGGVIPRLAKLARLHLASHWGSGQQWLSWIHEVDLARCLLFLLENPSINGPVNIASPNPVRNRDFMKLLAKITGNKVFIPPVPEYLLRIFAGEFASVFVNGQRIRPGKLLDAGFSFRYSNLEDSLRDLVTESKIIIKE